MRAWKNLPAVCETPPLKATETLARSRHVAAGCGTLILALAILPVTPIASATETGESVRPPQVLAAVPLPTGDAAQNVTNPVTAIPRQPLDWKVMGLIAVAFVAVLLIKVLAKRRQSTLPPDVFDILGEGSLGGQHTVRIVRFGPKTLLVSLSPSGCQTLSELTDPQATECIAAACRGVHARLRPSRFLSTVGSRSRTVSSSQTIASKGVLGGPSGISEQAPGQEAA